MKGSETEAGGEIDWGGVRAEFEIVKRYSYLNSAGTGPISRRTMAAAQELYREMSESGDRRWETWVARRERAREELARLINAEPDEIGFTVNASQGMNLIVDALEGEREVVSCGLEFPVSTLPWLHRGMRVRLVAASAGVLRAEELLAAASPDAIICLSHVQFSNGLRTRLEEIGERKGNRTFVVNASQSAGVLPIDVKRMRIDALCSNGHKWMLAGYGSGFVYLSRELQARKGPRQMSWMSVEHPFEMRNDAYVLRSDAASRSEMGCPHFPAIFALGAATRQYLELGGANIERRALALNRHLTESLIEAGWRVLSPLAEESLRSAETLVGAKDPARVIRHLSSRDVAVTIKPEGFRVSTHFFNDEEDIARLISALAEYDGE